MPTTTIQKAFARKSAKPETLAQKVIKQPELLPEVFDGLKADTARVKFGCLKVLRIISKKSPAMLYPELGRFFELLDGENNILKWGALIIIGNLAAVDSEDKIDGILERYLRPISGPVMITAANVLAGAGEIARAKPQLADRITRALLRVEAAKYQTDECRNVACGHALNSFAMFFGQIKKPRPVLEFVRRQLDNPRNAVKKRAAAFLKKHEGAAFKPMPNRA